MNHFFTKFIALFLFVVHTNIVQSQTKFIATITPSNAAINEYVTLKLTVENGENITQIIPPNLSEFDVVSGPNQETAVNNVNGIVSQYVSLSYILQPKKAGNFIIGNATAVVSQKKYKSNSLKLVVSNKKVPNNSTVNQSPFAAFDMFDEPTPQKQYEDYVLQKGETIPEKVNKNMQLKLQTNKNTCFVGEPIVATYKLYTRLKSESSLTKNPGFNGFSVIDIAQQFNQNPNTHETLNGREYNVYIIRKAQLYPLQPGDIELESASLDNKITFVKNNNGNAEAFEENVTLQSKPMIIHVKPLPEFGKPNNFSGSVGKFEIDAVLEKNIITTDETGKLIITILGTGNLQLLTSPTVEWPNNFEPFETKSVDNLNVNNVPLSGSKSFEIPFSVIDTGLHIIPPILFSYFDIVSSTYKTIATKPISINIVKAVASKITKPDIKAYKKTFIEKWSTTILFAVLLFLVLMSLIFFNKKTKNKIGKKNIELNEAVIAKKNILPSLLHEKNYLLKTEQCLANNNCNKGYELLSTEFKQFLVEKFNTPDEMFSLEMIELSMKEVFVENAKIQQTLYLLKEIEQKLYMPIDKNEGLVKLYNETKSLILSLS
ncbi:MAG: BatD family protein [Ferruginibacter sp.]|nr:protein BatD [Ferruginibacter sp.]